MEMIIVFLDINGVIMIEWAHKGQTDNQNYYMEVLIKLRERWWNKKSWFLHQDNALSHNALAVKQFLADKSIPAPYPNL
jgi:tRNA A37 threonylcarbamoyladenosine biosynthesis protein TsaE